jgi:hypothetical protein
MNSRLMPPSSSVSRPGSADAVVLVHHQVADLQVAEVGEEPAGTAAAAARLERHLLREDVAVRQHPQRDLGQLEARGERAHPDLDGGLLVDGEPVLAQHVAQAVRAAGAAHQEDAVAGRRCQVGRERPQVARVVAYGAAGDVEAALVRVEVAQRDPRRRLRRSKRRCDGSSSSEGSST